MNYQPTNGFWSFNYLSTQNPIQSTTILSLFLLTIIFPHFLSKITSIYNSFLLAHFFPKRSLKQKSPVNIILFTWLTMIVTHHQMTILWTLEQPALVFNLNLVLWYSYTTLLINCALFSLLLLFFCCSCN